MPRGRGTLTPTQDMEKTVGTLCHDDSHTKQGWVYELNTTHYTHYVEMSCENKCREASVEIEKPLDRRCYVARLVIAQK